MAGITKADLIRAVKIHARRDGVLVREVLESIILSRFQTSIVDGQTLLDVSDEGMSMRFVFPDGLSPAEIIRVASEALEWVEKQADPDNPGVPQLVKRFRATFGRACL